MAKETGIMSWKELELGVAVTKPGSAGELRTGDWRSMRPVTDYDKCTKCGQCYIFCPDMVYKKNAEGYYEANLFYCKGCGICAKECPVSCITMVQEGD
ncbi:4Fe-4S binding protein [Desulforhabdus amnigena]|uniref:Pyruvate synthase n=1 Tax=Desulforhabdus amnigena TaxID=40218 RepID=A0A9W6FV05_9BACT|nr:4Fe-4S binding protein [Desulforhabdus amnigena]NLJ29704.1 4Fe-4S binding protein [Deltaproteobacteria bacterium]GLI35344.1 pyruvate synthase [Desulforhabdus amnigena]